MEIPAGVQMKVEKVDQERIEVLRANTIDSAIKEEDRPRMGKAILFIHKVDGSVTQSKLSIVISSDMRTVYVAPSQLASLSDPKISKISCPRIPDLSKIKSWAPEMLELPFTKDMEEPILVPFNKSVVAGIIKAFYNGKADPLERVRDLYRMVDDSNNREMGRILITYYLSCIKYMVDIDMEAAISGEAGFEILLDDSILIPPYLQVAYLGIKNESRLISSSMVAFHAVYGAYILCRPVANKKVFRAWITKRFSAFMSSIQQVSEANSYLDLQKGGTIVNESAVERSAVRKIIYVALNGTYHGNIQASAIKSHIRMLTALAEMTTYSLIQKVIAFGGPLLTLSPLPSQLVHYQKEREKVLKEMADNEVPSEDIVYLHLVLPHIQCFTSATYADLVLAAQTIEEINDPKGNTLDAYKAKITNATISRPLLRQFILSHVHSAGLKVDKKHTEQLNLILGESSEHLYEEAEKILKTIRKQRMSGLE